MYTFRKRILRIITILSLCLGANAISELPAHFPRCHRFDPKLEECLLNATEQVRPYISEGVLDFIPPIKKFVVPQVTINQEGNRAYNFLVHIKNLTILGLDKYKFNRYMLKVNEPMSAFLDVALPQLYIKASYDLKGNLFFASLNGNGSLSANISNSKCKCNYSLNIVNKNGIGYLHATKVVTKMHIGNVTNYTFDGLFKENKDIELVTQDIMNKNLYILIEEITPSVEQVVSVFLNRLALSIENIPYDKLYPK